jgi:cytochrome P450
MTIAEAPALPRPPTFRGRLPLLQFLRTVRESSIATYAEEAYEEEIIERRILWRRTFILSAPDAVKRVLLDNADNYPKSALTRRLLEPGLGQGLVTSEGEMWRRHRRIMAPAFARPSLTRFAPMMVEATEQMLARWERLPAGESIDIASEMLRLTLTIIVRAMFSSDAAGDVETVEASSARYQRELRPTLRTSSASPSGCGRSRGSPRAMRFPGSTRSSSGSSAAPPILPRPRTSSRSCSRRATRRRAMASRTRRCATRS